MSATMLGILAFGMSIDAFVASLGRGARAAPTSWRAVLGTAAIFGAAEALGPVIGWLIGLAASQHVRAVDHWIAFSLLAVVGLRMAIDAWRRDAAHPPRRVRASRSYWSIVAVAMATSVDAMAVGLSLAVLDLDILAIAAATGVVTMLMATTGLMAGRYLGDRIGRVAEALGGLALIGLGTAILIDHLGGA